MTANELFEYVQDVKPHQYEHNTLLVWLNDIEKRIFNFFKEFEDNDLPEEFERHTSVGDELLTDEMEVYRFWLAMKIDFSNNEYTYANNDVAYFNEAWNEFVEDWGRKHKRPERGIKI